MRSSSASPTPDPNQVFAVSEPFTVLNRVLDVVRPTVTDSLSETSTFAIDWDWVGTLQRVSIDYRLDPALDWVPIISNIVNAGTYAWTVPPGDQDHRSAQIRVFDTNNPNTIDRGLYHHQPRVRRPTARRSRRPRRDSTIRWSTRGVVPVDHEHRGAGLRGGNAAAIPNTGASPGPAQVRRRATAQVRIEIRINEVTGERRSSF
jgi:hypothetical protein